jgi:hypothetical protein
MAVAIPEMVKRNDLSVKIDAEIVRKVKIVAAYRDLSIAEYLSETLRPIVERELRDYSRRSLDESPPKKGKG